MRTQRARATRLTFMIATIVLAAIAAWLPAIPAHAVQLKITVTGQPTPCVDTTTTNLPPVAPPGAVNLPASCGSSVSIAPKPGTAGAQAAAVGSGQNQVVIRNAVIKNNGTGVVTVVIDARHTFGVTVTNTRSYGVALNASFSRKNAANVGVLAAGDNITKTGTFTYTTNGTTAVPGTPTNGNPIGGGINFTVPTAGSVTQNTIPVPGLSATTTGRCTVIGCLGQETLKTVLTVKLNPKDQVTIPGGDHTIAGDCTSVDELGQCTSFGFVNEVIASLTAVAQVKGTPGLRVNPNDNGFLKVNLICNVSFRCENVDQNSLRFGPNAAVPKKVKVVDVNGDGFVDLEIMVRQPETGITCEDSAASLTGLIDFPGSPNFEFDAIAGFFTGPGC